MEELFKVLGDQNRLRILSLLMHQELCVCEIEEILQISQSNASRHLTKLKYAGIISCSKKAQWAYYRLEPEFISSRALLYQYLQEQMKNQSICREDAKNLQAFNENQESCKTLA